jgi:lysyl-tRNA synthetase class 2
MHATRVDKHVFAQFPEFRRGIVVAANMDNRGSSPELEELLKETIAAAAANPFDLKSDTRTEVWNEAYRQLDCNPNKFPPAHLSLLKRVQKPGASLPFINKIVAIMNINSIRGVLPVGGDDLARAGKILELRYADGSELFIPLDNPGKAENPSPGEIIYAVAETDEGMCRRWNWRNGYNTRITEDTAAMVMNIDGLGPGAEERCLPVRDSVAAMLKKFCGAEVQTALLSPESPSFSFKP